MRQQEYIGISGVVNQEQQSILTEIFIENGLHEKRMLQLGVKATHKTQILETENKYGHEWYPVGDQITDSIIPSSCTTGIAQVYFDSEKVNDTGYRQLFMQQLGQRAHTWLTGVQFDMLPWHTNPEFLVDSILALPERPQVYVQCHEAIMNALSPRQIAKRLGQLAGYIDYVLFDASAGQGILLDVSMLTSYLDAAYSEPLLRDTGIAIDGGLDAGVVRTELPKVLRRFPAISWDAEGRLHPLNSDGKRPLDMKVCRDYLAACADVLD